MHALVIGGTGILSDVSAHLLNRYKYVSVIARSESSFTTLLENAKSIQGILNPLVTDYSDSKNSLDLIKKSIEEFGNVNLCISWVHGYAENFRFEVAKLIADDSKPVFIDVLGSSGMNLSEITESRLKVFSGISGIEYRSVVLGKIHTSKNNWRWLTDFEISKGVIDALESQNKISIAGEI